MATVWAAVWMLLLAAVAGVGLTAAGAEARQHQVDGAADLAALSAATRMHDGGEPCSAAARVAAAHHTALLACQVLGSDVVVSVKTTLRLPFGWHPSIVGRARAGPR